MFRAEFTIVRRISDLLEKSVAIYRTSDGPGKDIAAMELSDLAKACASSSFLGAMKDGYVLTTIAAPRTNELGDSEVPVSFDELQRFRMAYQRRTL